MSLEISSRSLPKLEKLHIPPLAKHEVNVEKKKKKKKKDLVSNQNVAFEVGR